MTKKLFFLTPSLHIGGAERWILELAKNLKRWEPVGVCLTQEFLHPEMAAAIREVMPIYFRGENIQADALISWGIPTLASIVEGVKVPVVEVSHSDGSWDEQRACVYASCVGASHLAAVSQAAATAFPAILRDKVTVLPNGVDPARVRPINGAEAWRESTGVGDRPIALFLGRFADVKNPLLAMAALQKLPTDWVMVFVGHGPMEADIKAMAQQHFPERVMIVPPVQDVGDILAAANVMVVTSECEGHSLAINEAWLAGLPVVTTMFGWIQEMIEKHSGMVHVCSPDPVSIADQIMLADQVSGTEATKAVALEHYTIDAMVERWEDYLDAITHPTLPAIRTFSRPIPNPEIVAKIKAAYQQLEDTPEASEPARTILIGGDVFSRTYWSHGQLSPLVEGMKGLLASPPNIAPYQDFWVKRYGGTQDQAANMAKLWHERAIDIRDNGYKADAWREDKRQENWDDDKGFGPISVSIGPNGNLIPWDGAHRAAILRVLERPVEAVVHERSKRWAELKEFHKTLYTPVDHPDFADHPVLRKDTARFEAIVAHLQSDIRDVLIVGACTGFCARFIDEYEQFDEVEVEHRQPFDVLALEPKEERFALLRTTGVLCQKVAAADFTRYGEFDAVIGLSVYQHAATSLDKWRQIVYLLSKCSIQVLELPGNDEKQWHEEFRKDTGGKPHEAILEYLCVPGGYRNAKTIYTDPTYANRNTYLLTR